MVKGDFTAFLEALGAFESGIDPHQSYTTQELLWLRVFDPHYGNVDPQTVDTTHSQDLSELQYHVHNTLGFLGKYQFGEPLLIDLGYYTPASTGFYGSTATNEWQGTWTGKNGVFSKEDFMSTAQELAIREAFAMNMGVINQRLGQAEKTLDDFLEDAFTYTDRDGTHVGEVTISGILASAHLQGPGGVANLLLNGSVSFDEYGTNILSYMDKFGDYSSPFGASGDDSLTGSTYNETFDGGTGHNDYYTGDGSDKIVLTVSAAGYDTVHDFNLQQDVISLEKYSGVTFSDLYFSQAGLDALIHFPNGQTVELKNTNALDITTEYFVQGKYTLSWQANSGDTVIEHFNATHDLIDLNYAFGLTNLSLYEENGSTVIEVVGNGQRLILSDIPLDELQPFHFIKAPIGFANAFFDLQRNDPPPLVANPEPVIDPPPPVPEPEPEISEPTGDVYAYTWNWGSEEIISDFDLSNNKIDLSSFWTDFSAFDIYDNATGHAVIDLTNLNNQLIIIENVSVNELTDSHFIGVNGELGEPVVVAPDPDPTPEEPEPDPDPVVEPPVENPNQEVYAYTWNWGNHDVIDDFDAAQDRLDLSSFWTTYQAFDIDSNSNGDAVIDLTALNNQSITLAGVSVDALTDANFFGVNGDYPGTTSQAPSEALPEVSQPPTVDDDVLNEQQGNGGTLYGSDGTDVFGYTWGWGSENQIENFNPDEDLIDLTSFWTSPENVEVYTNLDGDAVIDLTDLNNQTIKIIGISAESLDSDNFLF